MAYYCVRNTQVAEHPLNHWDLDVWWKPYPPDKCKYQNNELQVSPVLISWQAIYPLDGASYLLKNWVYVYKL